ncbi:hypothetical protein BJF82_12800 [Kytococcus sp. CUA-901]|nr:hypothetical protein BJF82_12800 [Kytococcus sp. CUA-901]
MPSTMLAWTGDPLTIGQIWPRSKCAHPQRSEALAETFSHPGVAHETFEFGNRDPPLARLQATQRPLGDAYLFSQVFHHVLAIDETLPL